MSDKQSDTESFVLYDREGNVGTITLNRPEKRNALGLQMWTALDKAIDQAGNDSKAGVILVKGAGQSFCAGLDLSPDNDVLKLVASRPDASQKMSFYKLVRYIQSIHTKMERLPQPTIGVIQGHCLGAGLELALCFDIRLCSSDSVFALPESRLAIITDVGGLQRLPLVVGEARAREMAYRGNQIKADKAFAIGLVNEVYTDRDTLEATADEIAVEIASNPPLAVQGAKDVFLYNRNASLEESLDYTAARSAMILPSNDFVEAVTAFREKRPGVFSGS